MIPDAMKLIQAALQIYLRESLPELGQGNIVSLENIAMAQQLGGIKQIEGNVVMSLVNLEEEITLKNLPYTQIKNERAIYKNPPVSLNLFILFSVLSEQYDTSLKILSRIIEFFQSHKEISLNTTPAPGNNISTEILLFPDLYSPSFEQINHLWGTLGGKQVPFALYRIRLITIAAEKRLAEVPVIVEANINEPDDNVS